MTTFGMSVPKVIIDTDAGIDDAHAIFMALEAHKQRVIEVIAITTVQGNTLVHNVNTNVLRILRTVELMEIPVYSGTTKPLVHPWVDPEGNYHGLDGFGDAELPPMPSSSSLLKPQHAVWALIELVKRYPGEIVLTALGPLTNVALAIRIDPSFTSRLLDIYVMGGNTEGKGNATLSAEFNFACDPEAARVVLEETTLPIHLTPFEICKDGVIIPYSVRHEMGSIQSPAADLMNKIEAKHLAGKHNENWLSFDQLAMAWLIDDAKKQQSHYHGEKNSTACDKRSEGALIKTTQSCFATVELQGSLTRGQVVIDHKGALNQKSNVIIMTSVDVQRYLRYLRMALGAEF
ncbi:inosine-uridine preferring nucleoside hydrolase-like isoform X2 [Panulirus ornatus]|uniref:inosine-uridine preferring nucleoside hydrolase-like isoform X2 n=1 Tax=Panulirus ornatus TaxID=150431 RepID=UPI003A895D07